MLCRGYNKNQHSSSKTSTKEGYNLGEVEEVWTELAASEMRLNLMDNLKHYKVGFNDVEFFNLGIQFDARMTKCHDPVDKRIVEEVMKFKRTDEIKYRKKMIKNKLKIKKNLEENLGRKSNEYRRMMKHLNDEAKKKKEELREK